MIDVQGQALAGLSGDESIRLLLDLLAFGLKPTRIDLALDFVGQDRELYRHALASCEAGELFGIRKYKITEDQTVSGEPLERTLHLGSRDSPVFVRVYDKGLEQARCAPLGYWERIETEFKKERAVQVVEHTASSSTPGRRCGCCSSGTTRAASRRGQSRNSATRPRTRPRSRTDRPRGWLLEASRPGTSADGGGAAARVEASPAANSAVPDPPPGLDDVRDYVQDVARSYQVPVEMVAMLALGVASGPVCGVAIVHAHGDFREPPPIWALVLSEPGTRKSGVMSELRRPVVAWEHEAAQRMGPDIAAAQQSRRLDERRLKELESKASRSIKPDELARLREEARELAMELDANPVPTVPVLMVSESTRFTAPSHAIRLAVESDTPMMRANSVSV